MKKILLALLLSAAVTLAQTSIRSVTLAWDANPASDNVTTYSVYEQTGNSWTKLQDIAGTQVTLSNIAPGVHTFAVTASNAGGESPRSNSVVLPGEPGAPANARIITVTVILP